MRIDPLQFPAFAVDLDGVVTQTASIHAAAWKRLFDELGLPFDEVDYRTHVDGKPRRDGLRSFLTARNVVLREGDIQDLAIRKERYVIEALARGGVHVYPDAIRMLQAARSQRIRLAVVTSSANCSAVLASASLSEMFEVQIDGVEIARLGLRGKPAPDSFLEASRRLDSTPAHTAVFEDSIAGIEAAARGNFGLAVGVDRTGQAEALRRAGSTVVVRSLDEIEILVSTAETRA
jgi:beta-phosphoglucomutase family hydrolase